MFVNVDGCRMPGYTISSPMSLQKKNISTCKTIGKTSLSYFSGPSAVRSGRLETVKSSNSSTYSIGSKIQYSFKIAIDQKWLK